MTRPCKICGNPIHCYMSTYNKKKYCSKDCRDKDQFLIKKCPICKKDYKVAISRYCDGLKFHYCSKKCYNIFLEKEKQRRIKRDLKICTNCGLVFIKRHKNKSKKYFCSFRCSSEYRVGEKHHSYSGGSTITTQGYKAIKIGKKYILEHRIIMEEYIGRKLYEDEVIHHKDRNKLNNNINNLALMIKQDHDKMHLDEIRRNKKCKKKKEVQ